MTDLEMIKLCAEAMGYEFGKIIGEYSSEQIRFIGKVDPCGHITWDRKYDPLHDDGQAMGLVKRHELEIVRRSGAWLVVGDDAVEHESLNADLNCAIVECVAKMQASNRGADMTDIAEKKLTREQIEKFYSRAINYTQVCLMPGDVERFRALCDLALSALEHTELGPVERLDIPHFRRTGEVRMDPPTKRDKRYFQRLVERADLLRVRMADTQLRHTEEITQELHALDWAIAQLNKFAS